MLLLVKYTLLYGIVLMLVALGGMFSEHSGVINIALEGIMVIGGLGGVLAVALLPNTMPPLLIPLFSKHPLRICVTGSPLQVSATVRTVLPLSRSALK